MTMTLRISDNRGLSSTSKLRSVALTDPRGPSFPWYVNRDVCLRGSGFAVWQHVSADEVGRRSAHRNENCVPAGERVWSGREQRTVQLLREGLTARCGEMLPSLLLRGSGVRNGRC